MRRCGWLRREAEAMAGGAMGGWRSLGRRAMELREEGHVCHKLKKGYVDQKI